MALILSKVLNHTLAKVLNLRKGCCYTKNVKRETASFEASSWYFV